MGFDILLWSTDGDTDHTLAEIPYIYGEDSLRAEKYLGLEVFCSFRGTTPLEKENFVV